LGVYATPNPAYQRLASPPRPSSGVADPTLTALTVLDAFDGGEGRFASAPFGSSGSTFGITAASTASYTTDEAQRGAGSQQIMIVRDDSSNGRLRHLSGGGSPMNNRVAIGEHDYGMAAQGYVGFFLKTTAEGLEVGIGVDDGASSGSTGLEEGASRPVIADGKWHLYQWNLDDPAQWNNFAGGNGTIGGPNAYVDSVFFYGDASTAGETLEVFLDTVAYNPHGGLDALAHATKFTADFDADGRVDAADLVKWRGDFGANGSSDANGDGVSGGADLLAWQRRVGSELNSLAAADIVPEPHDAAPVVMAALIAVNCSGGLNRRDDRNRASKRE
jgi:hypothetical protein